ncbi:MAG: hypothetical protein HY978_00815 [Candidatus Liptonbacteria bacterium]|nr:hypothetical protein [Candidatus Liptonbacteria bacterium]
MLDTKTYLTKLRERSRESRVYREFQAVGLELAEILADDRHRALYIRLAKQYDGNLLRRLAREVAQRPGVQNRGAYFMRVLTGTLPQRPKPGKSVPSRKTSH